MLRTSLILSLLLMLAACRRQPVDIAKLEARMATLEQQAERARQSLEMLNLKTALDAFEQIHQLARSVDADDMYTTINGTTVLDRATRIRAELIQLIESRMPAIVDAIIACHLTVDDADRLYLRTASPGWLDARRTLHQRLQTLAPEGILVSFQGTRLPDELKIACLDLISVRSPETLVHDGYPSFQDIPHSSRVVSVRADVWIWSSSEPETFSSNPPVSKLRSLGLYFRVSFAEGPWHEGQSLGLPMEMTPDTNVNFFIQEYAQELAHKLSSLADSLPPF